MINDEEERKKYRRQMKECDAYLEWALDLIRKQRAEGMDDPTICKGFGLAANVLMSNASMRSILWTALVRIADTPSSNERGEE